VEKSLYRERHGFLPRHMARILITSGPTRQYLDPVRFLTNGSSGRMGAALAEAAIQSGHQVVIVSGPVEVSYPAGATVQWVVTTDEMLAAAEQAFTDCEGLIGVAAPCDYRPLRVADQKIAKTGQPLQIHLVETPDIVATLGMHKRPDQWVVGFALETEDHRFRAIRKLEQKSCDLMILNAPAAISAQETAIEMLDKSGRVILKTQGDKRRVAQQVIATIERELIGQ
jgi:phosphopantothenoylcysteine decarboxylase/phosphopantothenate--cysteine ligase